ncbi:GGDEF domain-containing protein [Desulfopila sp. IMCC35008]|uniref:GGDEF domain-containing protein n=1 Tax=Desulfopila sp. IMCC35008 TaxID=2653858 RepID=UPI0013D54DAC|nr:diguanylate cyclase [Desulfopila sp. IMCC35008]
MVDEAKILDTAENGILVVDSNLTILFWNNWLAVNTNILKEHAQGRTLEEVFPETSFKILNRKIRIAFRLKSSAYVNSTVDKYVIPIRLEKITSSRFKYMRQDAVITAINESEASVIIYDTTSLVEAKAIIDEHLEVVERQASTDQLTGCYNRKMFHERLVSETVRAMRHNCFFSIIIFDVDDFKSVNDTYGHLVGDEVLKVIASAGCRGIRRSDTFARWGGEEFIILLPETRLDQATVVAEKVRRAIAEYDCGEAGPQTCSFGVAEFMSTEGVDSNLIIYQADKALYFAKENGKNMVAVFADGEVRQV